MDAYVANQLRGHSAQGQTVPLYLACRVGHEEVVYQTKLAGRRSGLSPRELGVELLGTTLAHGAGLHVARPAMVTLPPRILEAVEREYRFGIEDATAFGVVWRGGLTPFLPDVEVGRVDEATSASLLALDLVLSNGDRTDPNPNVCWDGERLLVFDFEHCLELPKLELRRRLDLHLETVGPTFASHVFATKVAPSALRAAAANVLDSFAVEGLRRDAFALPLSWFGDFIDNVEYLGYIQQRPESFLDRLADLRP